MTSDFMKQLEADVADHQGPLVGLRDEMGKVIVGQEALVDRLLIALLTREHVLLEGVPGLAKTMAISTLARACDLDFSRIQFTPDLLPSDLVGSRVYNPKTMRFSVKKGPVFANFVLADEINRSPAKVQSALLEAMAERQVTIGEDTFRLDAPFLVMATQNPIEQEGTYQLPEAQVDRFLLKTVITYPSRDEELAIMERFEQKPDISVKKVLSKRGLHQLQALAVQIYADESVKGYIRDVVFATREPEEGTKLAGQIAFGASPRASMGLLRAAKALALMRGRAYVVPEDVKDMAMDVLRHRVLPTYEAQADGVSSEDLVRQVLSEVKVP